MSTNAPGDPAADGTRRSAGSDPPADEALRQHLQALEAELHHPGAVISRERLERLLHPDFHEVGKSGLPYGRAQVIGHLASQTAPSDCLSGGYRLQHLAEGCMLLCYWSSHPQSEGDTRLLVRRSSVWRLTDQGWQLAYHQGTPAPVP